MRWAQQDVQLGQVKRHGTGHRQGTFILPPLNTGRSLDVAAKLRASPGPAARHGGGAGRWQAVFRRLQLDARPLLAQRRLLRAQLLLQAGALAKALLMSNQERAQVCALLCRACKDDAPVVSASSGCAGCSLDTPRTTVSDS